MELVSGKMTSKGQITIPKELRDKLGLSEGDQFRFLLENDEVKILPIKKKMLSQAIGRIVSEEEIDLDKMRKVAQQEASEHLLTEDIDHE
ncbi:AbrB/MazE/SpoVT family DNA-binding domain-containing protein [Aquibacillus koreensis]|uniref:AbrB/MazE/SpoVT family DNA-binding domain-containing protein n=1 Tax=Aquibacillus koreensis TaxID=279446 RepID=A0A9X3WIT9_9BACI|nr:AbrB/MazE/SpoVT family DNA-binding domain-containing protein [Aquibacillus koreensis]MCT2538265.1 AbrB/MazE/SpoVT family DNA-binding domain-containing protein [Aquibacillus koreensis]MDC3420792.1 AbrB/MazE/SpoVT family DNA-binding domain-containing protein [Aquibacillus koreensis]